MPDRETDIVVRLAPGVASVPPAEWDALAGPGDPFLSHAFLSALEQSGSVGGRSGWSPLAIVVEEAGGAVAAMPAYLKTHSQGEYVFDHGWADAWQRAGGDYYPKLQVAVPFTPVPGRRLLGARPQALLSAAEAVVGQNGLSSAHITFLSEDEAAECEARGWVIRHGLQYHWFNREYRNFDDFLAELSSRKRKAIRKERTVAANGLAFQALRGAEIRPHHWEAMWRFYQHTGRRKWGRPYLTRTFFNQLGESLRGRILLLLASRQGEPIAGALNLIGEEALYGRYWGATEDVPFLHFELCYYRAMEWAIAAGLKQVQAGAQGEHKLARGYEPVITRSAHFIAHPAFRDAVERFVEEERTAVAFEAEALRADLPFRRG